MGQPPHPAPTAVDPPNFTTFDISNPAGRQCRFIAQSDMWLYEHVSLTNGPVAISATRARTAEADGSAGELIFVFVPKGTAGYAAPTSPMWPGMAFGDITLRLPLKVPPNIALSLTVTSGKAVLRGALTKVDDDWYQARIARVNAEALATAFGQTNLVTVELFAQVDAMPPALTRTFHFDSFAFFGIPMFLEGSKWRCTERRG